MTLRGPIVAALAGFLMQAPSSPGVSMALLVDVTNSKSGSPPSQWGWPMIPGELLVPPPAAKIPLWGPIQMFADGIRPDDRVAIGTVADRLALLRQFVQTKAEFSSAARQAMSAADGATRSTTTPLWDAIDETITWLETAPPPRAIVLVTDGKATGNRLGTDEVARHAVASGVTVHVILGFDSQKDPEISPSPVARRFAEATRGTFGSYSSIRTNGRTEREGPSALMKELVQRLHKDRRP